MTRLTLPLPVRRGVARHRRLLAAALAAVAVAVTITALEPDRGPSVTVLTAARPIAAGTTVSDADVTPTRVPAGLAPPDALAEPSEAVGLAVNAPLSERSIITRTAVASGQALAAPGMVVVLLPLTDEALVPLVRPGVRIDLYGTTASGPGVLASDVRVVAVPAASSGGFGSVSSGQAVLVEVTPSVAVALAQNGRQGVTVALR